MTVLVEHRGFDILQFDLSLARGIMRRTLASIPKVHALLAGAMLGIVLNCLVAEVAFPDPNETVSLESGHARCALVRTR